MKLDQVMRKPTKGKKKIPCLHNEMDVREDMDTMIVRCVRKRVKINDKVCVVTIACDLFDVSLLMR